MKITEMYIRYNQARNMGIAFVRSNLGSNHTRFHWNVTNASINRYARLTTSNSVIYYSRESQRFITINALAVGVYP